MAYELSMVFTFVKFCKNTNKHKEEYTTKITSNPQSLRYLLFSSLYKMYQPLLNISIVHYASFSEGDII
jgi:hypothetical protein